jgi:hypothetical protein
VILGGWFCNPPEVISRRVLRSGIVLSYRCAEDPIGLSIFTVLGLCSLGHELADFGNVCDASAASEPTRDGLLTENERSYQPARLFAGRGNQIPPATRIFSPLTVPRLCDTIGRYWYLFKRLTALSAGRFYRFEHIVSYSSGKVVGRWRLGTDAASVSETAATLVGKPK